MVTLSGVSSSRWRFSALLTQFKSCAVEFSNKGILHLYIACVGSSVFGAAFSLADSPLEDYVNATDASFTWEIVETTERDGYKVLLVDLVSQHWLTLDEVDRTEWRHWLVITVPQELQAGAALLYISGGSNNGNKPSGNDITATIATFTKSVVAELRMVPNQPLVFHNDGVPRVEDDLIGYAWQQYLQSSDPRWLPRGPMVKAAVRAMDTVTAVMAEEERGGVGISEFVVAGGSKRGWTTWLTGAFDERVIAIAPIVIDVVNVRASMQHHFAAYGFWSSAIADYVSHGLMRAWKNPKLDDLYDLVDPYSYLDRLKMPKLVLNAAGDQFFLPDSSQFYFDELQGPKYLRYVPNGDHGLDQTDAIDTLSVFFALVKANKALPEYTWQVSDSDILTVDSSAPIESVTMWQATNPRARDFRVATIGRSYTSTSLEPTTEGSYEVQLTSPDTGWTAHLMEISFDVGLPKPLKLSTPVYVLPKELPFADKQLDLDTSITLVCRGDGSQFKNVGMKSIATAIDHGFDIKYVQKDGSLFLNWPRGITFRERYYLMMRALDGEGCENPTVQLESGAGVTLPPVTQ